MSDPLHPSLDPDVWSRERAESVLDAMSAEDPLVLRVDGLYTVLFELRDRVDVLQTTLERLIRIIAGGDH